MAVLYGRYGEPAGVQEAEDVLHDAFAKVVGAVRNGSGTTENKPPNRMLRTPAHDPTS